MYDIKEIELTNKSMKKKRLVITFHDDKMGIVGEFLMTDAPLIGGNILNVLKSALNDKKNLIHVSGNRTHLQITKSYTTITDLFDETDGLSPYEQYTIDTKTLYKLTKMWLERLESY